MDLNDVFHVKTDFNPSDIGTRPEKVTLKDVGPESRWENGDSWMKQEISDAVNAGVLTPISALRIKDEEESEFRKGLIFEKVPEVLTRGHTVTEARVSKIEKRANLSQYLVLPTRFCFSSVVRILSHVMRFVSACRKGKLLLSQMLREERLWFSVFISTVDSAQTQYNTPHIGVVTSEQPYSRNKAHPETSRRICMLLNHLTDDMLKPQREHFLNTQLDNATERLTDKFVNMSLLYLYRKAGNEVRHFCTKEKVEKIAVDIDGVLLSKCRLLDTMNYKETGELEGIKIGDLGIRSYLPVIERYSPLAYSIADHVHWKVAAHKGIETCARICRESVAIIQSHSLFKELSLNCILCKKKRKRFLEVEMGPCSDSQLLVAPPFWVCQVDLFGPITVVVPGFERATRNRRVLEAKCWVMAAVCPTTRLVNLQVLESSKAAGWMDAFTRLACEVGCPSHVFCDQDSAGMSAFNIADVDLRDLELKLHREKGIHFSVCPVSGHDRHGHVERVIRSVQESFGDSGLVNSTIHATGLQTLCKLVENQYNNLPLGYHFGRDDDNSDLLKIITPNMLRVGRVNKRSLDGPIRLPKDRMEILGRVCQMYDSWFKVWAESMVPKLMYTPKWFKTDEDLKKGDLVYFPKEEALGGGRWIMGMVDEMRRGRDGRIRVVYVKYRNAGETINRVTERSVRKIVKLWGIDDLDLAEDLAELGRRFEESQKVLSTATPDHLVVGPAKGMDESAASGSTSTCTTCCCSAHHSVQEHLRKNQLGNEPKLVMDKDVSAVTHLITEIVFEGSSARLDDFDDLLEGRSKISL